MLHADDLKVMLLAALVVVPITVVLNMLLLAAVLRNSTHLNPIRISLVLSLSTTLSCMLYFTGVAFLAVKLL